MTLPAVVAGSAIPVLARAVAGQLGTSMTSCLTERFPDGEAHVSLRDSVSGEDVYVIQSTGPPVDEHLMELALLTDACRRAEAGRVTAVMPYFGYARQDRRSGVGDAVAIPVVANLLVGAGVDRILVVDPHSPALEASFGVPVESVSATPLLASALERHLPEHPVLVAPDLGAVKLAERLATRLDVPAAFVSKSRLSGTEVETTGIVGEVRGRVPVIVDDMVSTGGTLEAACGALRDAGSDTGFLVAATHGLLVGNAVERLSALPLSMLVLTDSLPLSTDSPLPLRVETLAGLLGTAIGRLHRHDPLGELSSHG